MPRRKQRKAYDPSKTHDRRAQDLPLHAEVAAVVIDDPMGLQAGDKIVAFRSIRGDPLARLHTHHQINEAQYQGGRSFQNDWEMAQRGPRAIDPARERVDGGREREPITEGQRRATLRLSRIEHQLGADGAMLVHDVLILGMNAQQVGERRGLTTQRWRDYFARRLQECLDRLALFYGFAAPARMAVKSLPR